MSKASSKEGKYFRIYYSLGEKRSLEKLRLEVGQDLVKYEVKTPPSNTTLSNWSKKFGWQKRIEDWDKKIALRLDAKALEQAIITKEQILKVSSAIIFTYAKILKNAVIIDETTGQPATDKNGFILINPNIRITPSNVIAMWKLQQEILKDRPLYEVSALNIIIDQTIEEINDIPDEAVKDKIYGLLAEIRKIYDEAYDEYRQTD